MATTTTTGPELATALLHGIGNNEMQAATRLLGAHRDGYWLRRFTDDPALTAAAGQSLIDRTSTHPCVDWDPIGRLLTDPTSIKASSSELAILRFAASIVGRCAIQLRAVMQPLNEDEEELVIRALAEVARGAY